MGGVFGYAGHGTPADAATMARCAGRGATAADIESKWIVRAAGAANVAHEFGRKNRLLALYGHPFIEQGGRRVTSIREVAEVLFERLAETGRAALQSLGGDFALAFAEPESDYLLLAIDRMGTRNVVYSVNEDTVVFGGDCDTVGCHSSVALVVDPQQIYNYLYFHMVPGPSTVYRGLRRIPPAHCIEVRRREVTLHRYWRMPFDESAGESFDVLRLRFREALEQAVSTCNQPGLTGTFLSGGTDSSTVSGLLARQEQRSIPAFSIGFDANGYDEMEYARIAANHFGLTHHAYYVTPSDVVAAIPRIAEAYDQPFGNASAVPTYFCAQLAQQKHVSRLLAGDGGDELFGGNVRYAKQQQFAYYDRIPLAFRQTLLEPLARRLPAYSPILLRKFRSYVTQASMGMPSRYESYNLLERIGAATIFTDDFLASIDPDAPHLQQRAVYDETDAPSLINRMLAFDFKFTLADNDLPKVTRMCELAGVDVAFPLLDDAVVAFSAGLPPFDKLRGTQLRYFFKRALADVLPIQIIAKEKHGFGMPFGVWLTSHEGLRELAGDSLASIRRRGFIKPEFIALLLNRDVVSHPRYYGTMVWILMLLEYWFRRRPVESFTRLTR